MFKVNNKDTSDHIVSIVSIVIVISGWDGSYTLCI